MRQWLPKGSKPRILSPPSRHKVANSGFVFPGTGELIINKSEVFNYEAVIASLRESLRKVCLPENRKVALILDNVPWYKKAFRLIETEALPEYADIREKLTIICLPPYSLDLNLIEQCWRVTRREVTHNGYFSDLQTMDGALNKYFEEFRSPNEKFRSLCSFIHK